MRTSDVSFARDVLTASSRLPVLVNFSGRWCGPCQALEPLLQLVAAELQGRLLVVRAEADDVVKHVRALGVAATPTLILFRRGVEVGRLVGHPGTREALLRFVQPHL